MTKPIHERIQRHKDWGGAQVYAEPEIRAAATTAIELPGGLLAVDDAEEWKVHVALFAFHHGPSFEGGAQVEPVMHKLVMYGEGPTGALRELRHSYWGDLDAPGYLHYPSAKLVCAAFEALKGWFDCE